MKKSLYIKPKIEVIAMDLDCHVLTSLSWTPNGGEDVYPVEPGDGGGGNDPYGGIEESKGFGGDWNDGWE